jgi:hypothetical protein
MGEFASNFLIALFLQRVMTLTPFQAGQMLLPGALTWGFSHLISGRLADKVNNGPRPSVLGRSEFVSDWRRRGSDRGAGAFVHRW